MEKRIPTHDPHTGDLNPHYEELTGDKNPFSIENNNDNYCFDLSTLIGREFKHRGEYGLSIWTDKVKKSSWKFCPECGNELVRTKTEIIYTNNVTIIHNEKHYTMVSYRMELNEFFEVHKNKLIYLKTDSIGTGEIRAIVID